MATSAIASREDYVNQRSYNGCDRYYNDCTPQQEIAMSVSHTAFASALIATLLLGCKKPEAPPKPTTMDAPNTSATPESRTPSARNPTGEKK
jgi:hypothetical protein